MTSLLSVLGAILALSFLIFIHELGHYFMARRVGMRVETFSIGFGRPLLFWNWQGVKWQIGWLPFGGFVKIAGTDSESEGDLYEVKDGFFGKSPLARIKVALMGPVVNILFALLVFALLYVSGGREKTFSEYTLKAGWIDPSSELYAAGVRPGDEILAFNDKPYHGAQDLMYIALTSEGPLDVKGLKVNYATLEKTPFNVQIQPYPNPLSKDPSLLTTGVSAPATYLIYDKTPTGKDNPIPEGSPLVGSGLQYGDRLLWVDGSVIFSLQQLSNLLNDGRALLTVERSGKTFLARAPRVLVGDIKIDSAFRDEMTDWQFAAHLNSVKLSKLLALPYNLTNQGVVETQMHLIDPEQEEKAFPKNPSSVLESPLQPGDKIIAVDGVTVKHSSDILKQLQERHLYIIVERRAEKMARPSYRESDEIFDANLNMKDLQKIVGAIGTDKPLQTSGSLVLLKPISPKTHKEIYEGTESLAGLQEEQKKKISEVEDPQKRAELLKLFEERNEKIELGVPVRDLRVSYNPVPTEQFNNVFQEIFRTLKALLTGSLNPKWMSGPVGIVAMFQEQSKTGLGDALFWLGAISLNLGVLNLLPIPMLDGGTVMLSAFEAITGKKIKPKTLEKLILPFAVLLMIFFVFLTFHDIFRIFGGLLKW